MGGNQTSLCPTNEKRSRSNASARVLRQRQPSSSTTHRSCPSLSPSIPLRSLPLSRHSPSPSSHSLSSSHHELRLRSSSRASFLHRILIFFINFSRALQTSFRHPFSNTPSCYIRSDLDLSSLFPCLVLLLHMHPRATAILLTNNLRIWFLRWGCSCVRTLSFCEKSVRSPLDRATVSVFRTIVSFRSNILLSLTSYEIEITISK